MHRHFLAGCCAAIALAAALIPRLANAHGYIGERLFPSTVATEDPVVADELSLSLLTLQGADERESAAGFEFSKIILPKLAIGIDQSYVWINPRTGRQAGGWENTALSLKYEVWRSDEHEAVVSIGLEAEIGGTGSKSIGREPFSVFVPTIFIGKGFGDLPDSLSLLRPFAFTASIGQTFPTSAESNMLEWGISLQYNIPYLQQRVKDFGIPAPFRNMIPLVEFSMATAENREGAGTTGGLICPGFLWESKYVQIGVEALIPVNHESGEHVGVMVKLDFYLDDLFPSAFGHPIFGD